jgi:hypothetical protein
MVAMMPPYEVPWKRRWNAGTAAENVASRMDGGSGDHSLRSMSEDITTSPEHAGCDGDHRQNVAQETHRRTARNGTIARIAGS